MDWLFLPPWRSIQLKNPSLSGESRAWISLNKVEWINNKPSEWWNMPVRGKKLAQMGQKYSQVYTLSHKHTHQEVMRQLPFWIGTVHLWAGHKIPLRITSPNHKIPCDKGEYVTTPPPLLAPLSPSSTHPLSHTLWEITTDGGQSALMWAERELNSAPAWLTDSDCRRYYHANSLR